MNYYNFEEIGDRILGSWGRKGESLTSVIEKADTNSQILCVLCHISKQLDVIAEPARRANAEYRETIKEKRIKQVSGYVDYLENLRTTMPPACEGVLYALKSQFKSYAFWGGSFPFYAQSLCHTKVGHWTFKQLVFIDSVGKVRANKFLQHRAGFGQNIMPKH